MQVLVIYYTRTGNTEKLADAIAEGVKQVAGVRCMLRTAKEVKRDDLLGADGVIAGSPVYFGGMAAQLKMVFDKFVGVRGEMENKVGAAFATGGDATGGKETTMLSILQAMLIYSMIIVGDPLSATGHYGAACQGTPDTEDLDHARDLGRRVAALVKRLHAE